MEALNIAPIDRSWQDVFNPALTAVDRAYLDSLKKDQLWLPGQQQIFNAFSQPLTTTQYILFGESPYPRQQSANGYAFWDSAVDELWSEKGLSTSVNRATSLRNLIKMLLLADGHLTANDLSQPAISQVNKSKMITSIDELFQNLLSNGFLLLNASLVLSEQPVNTDAKQWFPFMETLLNELAKHNRNIELILFGKIAERINKIPAAKQFKQLTAQHPYNLSFITNPQVIDFFQPFKLLQSTL